MTTSPVYIGIDSPSTNCGFGVLDASGERIESGVWSFKTNSETGGGMRFLLAGREFALLLDRYPTARVAYEAVRHLKGKHAQRVYHALVGQLQAACEARDVPYVGLEVAHVKQAATGSGRASKDQMREAARIQWGITDPSKDADEADALWQAETLRRTLEST